MPKAKIDPRSERKKAKDAKYAAEPIVRILNPFKYVQKRGGQWSFEMAQALVAHGNGRGLQLLAQSIYSR